MSVPQTSPARAPAPRRAPQTEFNGTIVLPWHLNPERMWTRVPVTTESREPGTQVRAENGGSVSTGDRARQRPAGRSGRVRTTAGAALWLMAGALVGALLGGVLYAMTPASFTASTKLMLVPRGGASVADVNAGANLATTMAPSYAQAVRSTEVLRSAARASGLSEAQLAQRVTADTPLNTTLINVRATGGTPEEAARYAEDVTQAFLDRFRDMAPQSQAGANVVQPMRLQVASPPAAPDKSSRIFQAIGAFAGLALAALVVIFARAIRAPDPFDRAPGSDPEGP